MANKNIAKSIRLTEEVYGYVMKAPGKGFNEKFENIILQAKVEEPARKKRLDELQRSIDAQQRKLYKLFDKYRYMDEFFRLVLSMQHKLYDAQQQLDKAMKESDNSDIKCEKENEYE